MDFDGLYQSNELIEPHTPATIDELNTVNKVCEAYEPKEEYLTEEYKQAFNQFAGNININNRVINLFEVRLKGNTIDRMIYCRDPQTFNKGMTAALMLSSQKDFNCFHKLVSFMASHRILIQESIHQQTRSYGEEVLLILGVNDSIQYDFSNHLERRVLVPMNEFCQHIESLLCKRTVSIVKPYEWTLDLEQGKKSTDGLCIVSCATKIRDAFGLSHNDAIKLVCENFTALKDVMATLLDTIHLQLCQLKQKTTTQHVNTMIEAFAEAKNRVIKGKLVTPDDIEDFILSYPSIRRLDLRLRTDTPALFSSPRDHGHYDTPYYFYYANYKTKIFLSHFQGSAITRKINFQNESIPMTKYKRAHQHWIHTNPLQFPEIASLLECTYDQVQMTVRSQDTLSSLQKQHLLEKVAEIHWLFANMMPFKRGSAAIGHMIAAHLMKQAKIEFSRVKKGICIDIDTFLLPLEKFVKSYPTFFETIKL